MGAVLILTDDPQSGSWLACKIGPCAIARDLYEGEKLPADVQIIIADVHSPHSSSIERLRRALAVVRGPNTPFLYLIYGSQERGEAQATLLGATKTLLALKIPDHFSGMIGALTGLPVEREPSTAVAHVRAARDVFAAMFTGETPSQDLVDHGTEIVNRAIRDVKVREWLELVAQFDDLTHRHCLTVAGLAAAFAATLQFNAEDAHLLTKGALLHDIGKSKISLEILNKPGRLTIAERDVMSRHAEIGFDMLKDRGFNRITLQVVRSHHEMLDGSGYPDGLRGDEIPDLVRLVTICDIFAALIERRPYKAPLSARAAFDLMTGMTGKLDPDLLRAFAPVAVASEGDEEPPST